MNEFAVSAADVGSGLSKTASALQLAGNTIQESAGMLTGITEVTQDPDKAGNALKILSLRIRSMAGKNIARTYSNIWCNYKLHGIMVNRLRLEIVKTENFNYLIL